MRKNEGLGHDVELLREAPAGGHESDVCVASAGGHEQHQMKPGLKRGEHHRHESEERVH